MPTLDSSHELALPPRERLEISLAMGLTSTRGKTEIQVADEQNVTRQCISKGLTRFLRMSGIPDLPAFGLKTTAVRRQYQTTNDAMPRV